MTTQIENNFEQAEYGKRVLKQFKSNYYLAGLTIVPVLDADGSINNIQEFIEISAKTENPFTCATPVEKIAAIAPKAVSAILEAINKMDAGYAEKKVLFDVFITNQGAVLETDIANELFEKFAEAYNDDFMEN